MRKTWWIVSALLLSLVVDVNAETLSQCTAKCKAGDDACVVCCNYRDNNARNACSLNALEELDKCRKKGTGAADEACDAAFKTAGRHCRDEATELQLTGKCPKPRKTSGKGGV